MTAERVVTITGRTLLALLFILAGVAKAVGPDPFLAHMAQFNVPGILLPGVVVLEVGAGVALLAGWRLRYAAGALAAFCLLAAAIFHSKLGIPAERTLFLKDIALAGALMVIAAASKRSPRA
jgi:putative oxidoreductase